MLKRLETANPCPTGYLIDLYCQYCDAHSQATSDGYLAYSYARKHVRQMGWSLHKDGYATCPKCKKIIEQEKQTP